jgi:hypothetical protein
MRPSDPGLVAATASSVKETKFQPHAPLSHISLDAFPLVQVRVHCSAVAGGGSFYVSEPVFVYSIWNVRAETCYTLAVLERVVQDAFQDVGFCSASESKVLSCLGCMRRVTAIFCENYPDVMT